MMSEFHNFYCDYNSKVIEIAYSEVEITNFYCDYNSKEVEIAYSKVGTT